MVSVRFLYYRWVINSKGVHGIFNVRNHFSAYCVHEGKIATDKSAKVLTQERETGGGGGRGTKKILTVLTGV